MKIFGTIYPFIERDDEDIIYGRHVANYDFFISLLTYSTFDSFHVFCLNTTHFNVTKTRLQQASIPAIQKQKIHLFLFNHLIEQLYTTEYHVFHLGGWGYFFPGLVYLRNKYAKNKFPITGLIHSLNGLETNYHALKICIAPLLPYDAIICSSKAGEKVLEKLFAKLSEDISHEGAAISYKGTTHRIPLGIDDSFLDIPDKKTCRKQLFLPDNACVLLTIGRLSPRTKADLYPLIKTFQKCVESNPDKALRLVIAGGANRQETELMKELIAECHLTKQVKLIANFETDVKSLLYGAADIYVSLSDNLQETFGISVIEAMAAGLPIVVSDIDGYSELVIDNETGFKISTRWINRFPLAELAEIMNFSSLQLMLAQCMVIDTGILFTSLSTLINKPDLRISMGRRAKEIAGEKYRWQHIIGSYETLWDDLRAQSQTYTQEVPVMNNPFMNDYLNLFSHYPTHTLSEKDLCTITREGLSASKSGTLPLPYTNIDSLLNNQGITDILTLLSTAPCTVKEIESQIITIKNEDIPFVLLWMAKYSLIHIV